MQLFKSLLYFSRPGQVQPADISEASCQATMCFPGLRGLCQAFRGDLRWMKEAQAPASPATFFAFPTCTSAGDPLGLELAGESVSSQKNPSFCGILRVVRLGLRVVTANRVNVLGSGSAMRIGRCGTAAGLRGCGVAAGRLWLGRLWGGCGAAVGLRGCGAAAGRLRGGCGAAAAVGLRGGCALDTKTAEFASDFGPGGGTLQPRGGCTKTQKTAEFAQGDFGSSGGTLQPIWGCTKTQKTAEFAQGDFGSSGGHSSRFGGARKPQNHGKINWFISPPCPTHRRIHFKNSGTYSSRFSCFPVINTFCGRFPQLICWSRQ